jgi:hypothetical protein
MKITEIREVTQPISSSIRNAYIDFSKMTLPELPGIGFEGKSDLCAVMKALAA